MDGGSAGVNRFVRTATASVDAPGAAKRLAAQLGRGPFALVLLFVSNQADFSAVVGDANAAFRGAQIMACTTAGELCAGYTDGTVVAVGLPSRHFAARVMAVPDMTAVDSATLVRVMTRLRNELIVEHPDWTQEFDFLLVDGMSLREDELIAFLAPGLGGAPLFGGSAADGTAYRRTFVAKDRTVIENGAVLALVRTDCHVRVFKADHLQPTEARMVVTSADPARRIVHSINAEPAAREYARILGKDPEQIDTFTFAAHPLVVRMGGQHHVRSIQQMTPDGDLVFFCAIDEGMVLTLAEPEDMVQHLEEELAALNHPVPPDAIIACDCVLRRKEAEDKQIIGPLSQLLRQHRVVGFSTYGEQFGALHVNQTLTGVAIYPPRP